MQDHLAQEVVRESLPRGSRPKSVGESFLDLENAFQNGGQEPRTSSTFGIRNSGGEKEEEEGPWIKDGEGR